MKNNNNNKGVRRTRINMDRPRSFFCLPAHVYISADRVAAPARVLYSVIGINITIAINIG